MLRTPLYDWHVKHGGKMVDFAGWEMPLLYQREGQPAGIVEEHHQVRKSGGIFDVSHMGRVRVGGRHSRRFLERLCTRRVSDMTPGQCRYSLVCNERGGVRDDVLVYKFDDDDWLLVVNASNREKLLGHFEAIKGDLVVKLDDQTQKTAMVAIQGPKVMELIGKFSREVPTLKRYRFTEKNLLIVKLIISRTGYTGEDGVEAILPAGAVGMAMGLVLKDAKIDQPDAVIRPAGLGARDTLRLEAGMPLYGNELGEDIDALASGLDFAMNLDKDQDERGEKFIGCEALKKLKAEGGPKMKLVGLEIDGKRTARQHMAVTKGGQPIGEVTSGCLSPTLGKSIAMAYVPREHAEVGTNLTVDTGKGATLEAKVCAMPFYKK
ncbi:MAG TPA: glycine cleavage system aminomethyltransferase GcvT [Phycisphaerales bacterium]|nr:glycine cleavage system aminomethyltransferase GcvT [Phycisphaerales bacterium]